ncbi:MAG: TetR/AcrR family transcriptional regulator [Gammaproteobacteria bacterium]|nr:TetR/AcrR family transcriptional regulator [Gammaproteobacteria bacterium]
MSAALDLFAERDFASVTIKDIAQSIGVNTALIYYYFDSKEDLFRETIENAVGQALDNYKNLREKHDDPVDLINDWFYNNLQLSEPIRKLVKIMLDSAGPRTRPPRVDTMIKQFYDEECSILSDCIRRGMSQGAFQKVNADRLALFVSTHLDGIMVAAMIRPNYDIEAAISELRQLLWKHLGVTRSNKKRSTPAQSDKSMKWHLRGKIGRSTAKS